MIQKTPFFLLSLVYVLLICSCRSPLSEGDLDDLSAIDARIEISQDLTDKSKNEVAVFLYDEDGKPIRNKDVRLNVNGIPLTYIEKQELYYTTTSRYAGSDIPVKETYDLDIILTNGESHFLGRIKSLGESNEDDIVCDEKGAFDKDLVVSWKNLKDISELSVSKGALLNTSTEMQQNYDSEPEVTRKIGSSGTYIIPKEDYNSPTSTISMVEFKFSALKSGTMNPGLLKGSEIKISGHIDKTVDFDEQSKN